MRILIILYIFCFINSSFVYDTKYTTLVNDKTLNGEIQRVSQKILFLCATNNIEPTTLNINEKILPQLTATEKIIFKTKIEVEENPQIAPSNNDEIAEIPYSRTWVALFAFPFFIAGLFGLHRFALGYKTTGIIQILLMTAGFIYLVFPIINFVWVSIDFVRICLGKLQFKDGSKTLWTTNKPIKKRKK